MAKQKKIPWADQIRDLISAYRKIPKNYRHGKRYELISRVLSAYRKMLRSADYDGVRWTVDIFLVHDDVWRMTLSAAFSQNTTRWMKTLKTLRDRIERVFTWPAKIMDRRDSACLPVEVSVTSNGVRVDFRKRDSAKRYCKKHKIRDINANVQMRSYRQVLKRTMHSMQTLKSTVEEFTTKWR